MSTFTFKLDYVVGNSWDFHEVTVQADNFDDARCAVLNALYGMFKDVGEVNLSLVCSPVF